MTAVEFAVLVTGLLFGIVGAAGLIQAFDLRRPNFQGERIPAVAGLFFVLCGGFVYAYEWLSQGLKVGSAACYFLVTIGFGVLGFMDDVYGDRKTGGFRGHFRALRHGRVTTGAAKALGGGVISLVAGYLIGEPVWWRILLSAVLIALSANLLNLLDLRPGRCLFGFFVASTVLILTLWYEHSLPVGFLLYIAVGAALILYPLDAMARVMLGDTGSNAFGAVLGVAAALIFSPFWQAMTVACLIAFHVWSESHSLTRTIESNGTLRRIDRKIGLR